MTAVSALSLEDLKRAKSFKDLEAMGFNEEKLVDLCKKDRQFREALYKIFQINSGALEKDHSYQELVKRLAKGLKNLVLTY